MAITNLPDAPPAPHAPRRVRLHPFQWVGLALLLAMPVLALAGVFGESWRVEHVRGANIAVQMRYPSRFRYKQLNQIEVQLRNHSASALDTVRVSLDTAFLTRFSTVRALPAFERPFELALSRVEPGASALVIVEIQAERYGTATGTLTVTSGGGDTVRVPLHVRVFP